MSKNKWKPIKVMSSFVLRFLPIIEVAIQHLGSEERVGSRRVTVVYMPFIIIIAQWY